MGNELLPLPRSVEETDLPHTQKSHIKAMALGSPLLGGIGATAIEAGLMKFDSPNPTLLIGGAIIFATGFYFAIKGRNAEEGKIDTQAEKNISISIEPIIPLLVPQEAEIFPKF